jgi:hypothetical protein
MLLFAHNDERHKDLIIATPTIVLIAAKKKKKLDILSTSNNQPEHALNSLQFSSRHGVVLSF